MGTRAAGVDNPHATDEEASASDRPAYDRNNLLLWAAEFARTDESRTYGHKRSTSTRRNLRTPAVEVRVLLE